MSDQQPAPKSYAFVQFTEPGSVIFQATFEGVTPLQLLALASYLEVRGKNALVQQENERMEREAQQQLSVPKPGILVSSGR